MYPQQALTFSKFSIDKYEWKMEQYSFFYGNTTCYICHLFTETEGNSEFCGPETAERAVEGPQNSLFSPRSQ